MLNCGTPECEFAYYGTRLFRNFVMIKNNMLFGNLTLNI